jgi:hypothetical protein
MLSDQDLVSAVRAYALKHYEQDGWDYVVECWEDKDILDIVKGCKQESQAIRKVKTAVKTLDEYRQDIIASGY